MFNKIFSIKNEKYMKKIYFLGIKFKIKRYFATLKKIISSLEKIDTNLNENHNKLNRLEVAFTPKQIHYLIEVVST